MSSVLYVIYDERAADGDPDDATVLSTAYSLKEAKRDARDMGGVVYRYDIAVDGSLTNPEQLTWPQ